MKKKEKKKVKKSPKNLKTVAMKIMKKTNQKPKFSMKNPRKLLST